MVVASVRKTSGRGGLHRHSPGSYCIREPEMNRDCICSLTLSIKLSLAVLLFPAWRRSENPCSPSSWIGAAHRNTEKKTPFALSWTILGLVLRSRERLLDQIMHYSARSSVASFRTGAHHGNLINHRAVLQIDEILSYGLRGVRPTENRFGYERMSRVEADTFS